MSSKLRLKVHDLGEVNNFGSEVKRDRDGGVIVISNTQKIKDLAESIGISESDRGYSTPMCKGFVQTEQPQGKVGMRMRDLVLHYRMDTGTWSLSDRWNIWPKPHGQIFPMRLVCLHVIVLPQQLHTCVQG